MKEFRFPGSKADRLGKGRPQYAPDSYSSAPLATRTSWPVTVVGSRCPWAGDGAEGPVLVNISRQATTRPTMIITI